MKIEDEIRPGAMYYCKDGCVWEVSGVSDGRVHATTVLEDSGTFFSVEWIVSCEEFVAVVVYELLSYSILDGDG